MEDWKDILYKSYKDKKDNFKTEQINIKGIKKVKTPLNLNYENNCNFTCVIQIYKLYL
tara:strand:- start:274 stop:447 length:174 start_codon:yes stop_codon:yes gene_type:complete